VFVLSLAHKLLEVSEKAQEHARCRDEGYALVTAQISQLSLTAVLSITGGDFGPPTAGSDHRLSVEVGSSRFSNIAYKNACYSISKTPSTQNPNPVLLQLSRSRRRISGSADVT
jgi:hypothetical protein